MGHKTGQVRGCYLLPCKPSVYCLTNIPGSRLIAVCIHTSQARQGSGSPAFPCPQAAAEHFLKALALCWLAWIEKRHKTQHQDAGLQLSQDPAQAANWERVAGSR